MKKPLGELYSGGPERSVEAELRAKPEKVPLHIRELRHAIERVNKRLQFIHEILRQDEEDIRIMREKLEAMPLKVRLAQEQGSEEAQKAAEEFDSLQKYIKKLENQAKDRMEAIKKTEEQIKEMEKALFDKSWRNPPSIGEA